MVDDFNSTNYTKEVINSVFEINPKAHNIQDGCLYQIEGSLTKYFQQCYQWADARKIKTAFIGIPPHVTLDYFSDDVIADLQRYQSLDNNLRLLRDNQPWEIDFENEDHFHTFSHNISLEGLTTSTQFHLKVPYVDLVDVYNLSQWISPIMVALSANAPFIQGLSLWHESRIPLFHQTVTEHKISGVDDCIEDRVLFGKGFITSIEDIFAENLNYQLLLEPDNNLAVKGFPFHLLRLQNSTIWRWNRVVFGVQSHQNIHLRIEHRSQSAGTSPVDIAANFALYIGLIRYWLKHKNVQFNSEKYLQLKETFFHAAKYGLDGLCKSDLYGSYQSVPDLFNGLIEKAMVGLISLGISKQESEYYLKEILAERIHLKLNGATWQLKTAKQLGKITDMFECYLANQKTLQPIHKWQQT
jgi:hypothetical protein